MATYNLTQSIASGQPTARTAVQFDRPGELNLTTDQAKKLLTDIRGKLTVGGTVQTGYLSLQKAGSDFTIENRSRLNAFGDKDGAATLVKELVRIA